MHKALKEKLKELCVTLIVVFGGGEILHVLFNMRDDHFGILGMLWMGIVYLAWLGLALLWVVLSVVECCRSGKWVLSEVLHFLGAVWKSIVHLEWQPYTLLVIKEANEREERAQRRAHKKAALEGMSTEQQEDYDRGYSETYDEAFARGQKEGKEIGYKDGYAVNHRLDFLSNLLTDRGTLNPHPWKSLHAFGYLLMSLFGLLIIIAIEYGLYKYLSPIPLDALSEKGYFYDFVGVVFLGWSYLTAKAVWGAVEEVAHFLHWIALYILDRNKDVYMPVTQTKKQQDYEKTDEYKRWQIAKQHLEEFYESDKRSEDIYYLLGRENGSLEGEINGLKDTYEAAWIEGSTRRAEVEAEKRRRRQYVYYEDSSKREEREWEESCKRAVEMTIRRREDARRRGDPYWAMW